VQLYGFGYRSNTSIDPAGVGDGTTFLATNDVATTWGFGGRAQLDSLELNAGWYQDKHNHGTDVATEAKAKVFFGELSYVLFPWMVPAIRVENISLDAQDATGVSLPSVNAWHVMPGVAFLIRPNLKLVVVANWEKANGFPSSSAGDLLPWAGGTSDVGAFTIAPSPSTASATSSSSEFETVGFFFAWAI
jgi:predicted porin